MKNRSGAAPRSAMLTGIALVAISAASCGAQEMPPVEATRPSQDSRILESDGKMSDGSPIPAHITETVATSIEINSDGVIGGVSVDADGNIYNANFTSSVYRTAPDGTTVLLNDEFASASGNLPLSDGSLLQADWREDRIYRIEPDGTRSLFAEAGLDGPVGMLQRPNGDIIVANHKGPYLTRVPETGGAAEVVLRHEKMTQPNGVTQDDEGNIYIADLGTGIVLKWTPEGEVIELAELPGSGNAHNVVAGGALYVNKIWDHVVYKVDLETGAFGIVTGNGYAGYEDGPTGVATIEEPNGIATNAARDVVYFNTHRGTMGEPPGRVVLRRLVLPR